MTQEEKDNYRKTMREWNEHLRKRVLNGLPPEDADRMWWWASGIRWEEVGQP